MPSFRIIVIVSGHRVSALVSGTISGCCDSITIACGGSFATLSPRGTGARFAGPQHPRPPDAALVVVARDADELEAYDALQLGRQPAEELLGLSTRADR